jgi:hypothetical protein
MRRSVLVVFTTVFLLFGLIGVAAVSAGPDGGGGSGKDCPADSPGGQAVPPRQAPNCGHPGDPVVAENCTNNADDDGDGLVDDEDTDCPIGSEGPFGDPSCSDGRDNDRDGFEDAADPDCEEDLVEVCGNNADDDGDGLIDEEDTDDCPLTGEGPAASESCSDGIDNDGDTLVDADDPGCASLTPGNRCDNPGLLTNPTLGETLSKGGLHALSPLIDDPEGDDGALSTPLGDAVGSILGQKAGDDVACAGDLIIDETATSGADV